jgi:DNA-binding response OmpR family regulator
VPPRILLLEDDVTIREIFEMVLSEAGYSVRVAGTVAEAIRILGPAVDGADLVMSDNHLGHGEWGRDLLRMVRARRPETWLVGLTGAVPDREVLEDPGLAGVHWIQKPVMPDKLLAAVAALVGPAR